MQPYSFLMLACGAGLFIAGFLLFCGSTGWLYSFNRSRVRDKKAYARFLGKGVMGIGGFCWLSALVFTFVGETIGLAVFIFGIIFVLVMLVRHAGPHYR